MKSFMEQAPAGESVNETRVFHSPDPADASGEGAVVAHVMSRFQRAKTDRLSLEKRWLQCYNNYRGIYNEQVRFTETERSKAFIKITKTKVIAAFNQIVDVLFAGNTFPIGVRATPVSSGAPDAISVDISAAPQAPTPEQSAPAIPTARPEILERLSARLKGILAPVQEKVSVGAAPEITSVVFEPAKEAARKMQRKIHDQIGESSGDAHLRHVAFEMALFGTGILKGPFAYTREYPRWAEDGSYDPLMKDVPRIEAVSIWDAYPDPDARSFDEMEFFIQRHRMTREQVRALKRRPLFRKKSVDLAIDAGANYTQEHWETSIESIADEQKSSPVGRYEVLEYWGVLDRSQADDLDISLPKELDDFEDVQVNIWICNGVVLRAVLNPFMPRRIPYFITPYEVNPYSLFGVGVAENMFDTQMLMNGFIRLAVDNGVLSANLIFELNEDMIAPGQDMKLTPGKIIRRQGGAPGQALFAQKIPNITNEIFMMFDKARQLADESTGIPSYSHGQTGISGIGRTASGMSMLMGAAAQNIKGVVRNIDDFLLGPLGRAMFAFNMQFDFDPDAAGDLEVVSLGTESLLRNEVRSQKLLQFLQVGMGSPVTAPKVNVDYILRELAVALDLEEDRVVNDEREAKIQASLMQMAGGGAPQQQGNPAGLTPPESGAQTGELSPGAAPEPGSAGFSGTTPPNAGAGQ